MLYLGIGENNHDCKLSHGTVGKHMVVFALNANFLYRAPVLSALCKVSQAGSTMKITLGKYTKFHLVWM